MARGKSYPVIGLKEALRRAQELYDQEGKAMTTPEVAVTAWDYTSLNGTSLRVLSALRQYGLLADSGDQTKLSDRALAIVSEPDGSAERAEAILAAAIEPTIFREMIDQYVDGLPSDATIKSYLIRKQGLQIGPSNKAVRAFRETNELVQEVQSGYSAPIEPSPSVSEQKGTITSLPKSGMTTPPSLSGTFTMPIPLPGGDQATLTTPRQMTSEAFRFMVDTLKPALQVYKNALVKDEERLEGD